MRCVIMCGMHSGVPLGSPIPEVHPSQCVEDIFQRFTHSVQRFDHSIGSARGLTHTGLRLERDSIKDRCVVNDFKGQGHLLTAWGGLGSLKLTPWLIWA
jgi:hypothetical protein